MDWPRLACDSSYLHLASAYRFSIYDKDHTWPFFFLGLVFFLLPCPTCSRFSLLLLGTRAFVSSIAKQLTLHKRPSLKPTLPETLADKNEGNLLCIASRLPIHSQKALRRT